MSKPVVYSSSPITSSNLANRALLTEKGFNNKRLDAARNWTRLRWIRGEHSKKAAATDGASRRCDVAGAVFRTRRQGNEYTYHERGNSDGPEHK